jgi:hypothetical protein
MLMSRRADPADDFHLERAFEGDILQLEDCVVELREDVLILVYCGWKFLNIYGMGGRIAAFVFGHGALKDFELVLDRARYVGNGKDIATSVQTNMTYLITSHTRLEIAAFTRPHEVLPSFIVCRREAERSRSDIGGPKFSKTSQDHKLSKPMHRLQLLAAHFASSTKLVPATALSRYSSWHLSGHCSAYS